MKLCLVSLTTEYQESKILNCGILKITKSKFSSIMIITGSYVGVQYCLYLCKTIGHLFTNI